MLRKQHRRAHIRTNMQTAHMGTPQEKTKHPNNHNVACNATDHIMEDVH